MPCRCTGREALRGGCHTVDTVFSHPASAHHDQITWGGSFFSEGSPLICDGIRPIAVTNTQTLPHISLVKPDLSIRRRDAAFVAPVAHPFDDSVQETFGMKIVA